jgi:hypothetical protein
MALEKWPPTLFCPSPEAFRPAGAKSDLDKLKPKKVHSFFEIKMVEGLRNVRRIARILLPLRSSSQ